jgi:hypothetical protein
MCYCVHKDEHDDWDEYDDWDECLLWGDECPYTDDDADCPDCEEESDFDN